MENDPPQTRSSATHIREKRVTGSKAVMGVRSVLLTVRLGRLSAPPATAWRPRAEAETPNSVKWHGDTGPGNFARGVGLGAPWRNCR